MRKWRTESKNQFSKVAFQIILCESRMRFLFIKICRHKLDELFLYFASIGLVKKMISGLIPVINLVD